MVMGLMSKSKSNFRFQDAQRARDFLKPGFVVQNTEDLLKACVSHGLLVGGWVCCEHSLEPLQHMVILALLDSGSSSSTLTLGKICY